MTCGITTAMRQECDPQTQVVDSDFWSSGFEDPSASVS